MTIEPVRPRPGADGAPGALKITPTDVSQFVRFESCERFLRFQLHSRNVAYRFMDDFGLRAQTLSPLLTRSGADFEKRLENALSARSNPNLSGSSLGDPPREAMSDFSIEGEWEVSDRAPEGQIESGGAHEEAIPFAARSESGDRRRKPDNERVLQIARGLAPGRTAWLLQPRLVVRLHGWELRGDVDVLRLRRGESEQLQVLVADMKASPRPKIDQKLQVAFYHEMLAAFFAQAGLDHEPIACGVLYRGPLDLDSVADIEERRALEEHKALARREFGRLLPSQDGVEHAFFDPMDDREAFILSAHQMVFDQGSFASQAASKAFEQVGWHLSPKCDGCPFSEWCLQSANQSDDLSLLPHLDPDLKLALRARGVRTVQELSRLKNLKPDEIVRANAASDAASDALASTSASVSASTSASPSGGSLPVWEDEAVEEDAQAWNELETAPEHGDLVRQLSATRGVGARLDEMILRSHAILRKRGGDFAEIRAKKRLSRRGHPSLPFTSPDINPNLVTLYIDAQYDFLNARLYALGSLVVAHDGGVESGSRSIVRLADAPPKDAATERDLLNGWINDTLRAVLELSSATAEGEMKAPLHLVFFDAREQKELLEALGRHFESIRAATPLYDFVQQVGSFDSNLASFLDQEMRQRRNYPLTCPSLYEVASWLRFDWNDPMDFRQLFRERLFDGGGFLELQDDTRQWQQKRARYGSSIPLEYAHAAWNLLPAPQGRDDPWQPFRQVTRQAWLSFAHRRLQAIKHVAGDFEGNKLSSKTLFSLPDIGVEPRPPASLADALEEFLMLERHATLGTWKAARNAPPERRALAGDSLVCRYLEEDQDEATRAQNRQNPLIEARRRAWRNANPDKKQLPRGFEKPDYELSLRLRLDAERSHLPPDELLALSALAEGQRVILAERYSSDSRLPIQEQKPFQTTAKQILYSMRGDLAQVERSPDGPAWLHLHLKNKSATDGRGFTFGSIPFALSHGQLLSIEPEINEDVASDALKMLDGLRRLSARNTLLDRLQHPRQARTGWSAQSQIEQRRFMDGLQVLALTDPTLAMEQSKQEFIAERGDAAFLLVQGPPGTGKTYASSWALLSRLQAAIIESRPLRILVSCKTHSAIDVLLRGLKKSLDRLRQAQKDQPQVFAKYFDARLLDVPLLRYIPSNPLAWAADVANEGIQMLLDKAKQKEMGLAHPRADALLRDTMPLCVLGATPNACYRMCAETGSVKDGALFGHEWFQMLVVDEASQMSLPEAAMSALALAADAPIVIVGDPRQMPPIVAHDWENETRRTFARFKAFVSLYDAVSALDHAEQLSVIRESHNTSEVLQEVQESQAPSVLPGASESASVPRIRFAQSFRLHRDMAEFLRREIYARDGIRYHSVLTAVLEPPALESLEPLVRAALDPRHPLVVIVHDEANSVLSNEFEYKLAAPILRALAGADGHNLDAREGLGVVVPHRAQRALMRDSAWNVDTVERFQGDEREAMLFCATESERGHLLRAGGFLFDPRRLNVALSRAKKKMILIAGREVFNGFFAEPETFANAMLWKNLLRHTCNISLFKGEQDGIGFQVWGNDPNWK